MPMGLCNSASVFERLMETVLSGLTWKICLVYLDDVIIFSKSFEEHMKNLKEVFQRLKAANLKLNPKKCNFLKTEVKFLGHIVSESGVATDPNTIRSVKNWPVPKSVKDVRSFLGLTSYYRKLILKYADKAKPLYKVTEKNQKFVWTDDCQQSFEELKNTLISAPILAYLTREDLFILDTDASKCWYGSSAIPTPRWSRKSSRSERKYCVTRRELLAVVASIRHFHHYLYGKHFKVRSDHDALSWLFNFKNPEGQLARWFEVLASYDFKIEHRAGRSHNNADALSRRPCYNKECPHCARAEINYELVPTHKNVLTVEKCNDNVTVSESCRNVQDVSDKQSVTTTSISCINEDRPNMTGDETCHKVKSQVIHNEFKSKGPDKNLDVLPVQSKIVRVCTRSKDYGCIQNEKDNPVKEINFENVLESQLSDDVISIIIQWKIDEVKPTWADVSHMSPEVKFYWSRLNSLILVNGILYRKWESYNGKHYDLHIVLPANFKRFVLNQVHNTVTGGHLDQGSNFESHVFKEMCNILGIHKTRTTPFRPQSDGMVEKSNSTIETMLSAFVSKHQRDWDEYIYLSMLAYRSSEHESLGTSPCSMLFGREVNLPVDLILGRPETE
ncbi:Retrovirus-related Pol polyprotein from transposon 297,Retrovirus-related Pol polyprotein from transposon 17.6 [Mytilus coruscus]|uniref:Retrovirus-related Pol polyprotein from transposon 297,Retrovirus-related Pol polyprotein from transposon 17.6 n=1 Tax=Mytilus coruscus TaxID=42192 RepID=A0A6J8EW17_MYTCO|nr:Retrovirus-related Pol polyprotein from transposon 297,Retrovirus-related Pol polyprotein from transposon 17.6 [Mytilus coruscus]